jgi:hypothetical protein
MILIPALDHPAPMSVIRIVIAVGLLAVVAICGLWSTFLNWEMMEKVNSRLPEGERFQPLWWNYFKRARLNEQYRRFFPDGRDLKRINWIITVMFAAVIGIAIALRILF